MQLSCSCMPNIKTEINAHNRQILRNTPSKKRKLPDKRWLSQRKFSSLGYQAHCNHKKAFNVPLYKYDTKLSTEYWNLKTRKLNPRISSKIKGIYKSYNPTSKRCNLCLTTLQKLEILNGPNKNSVNKRSENISQCRHKNKYRLKKLPPSMTSGDITYKDVFTL